MAEEAVDMDERMMTGRSCTSTRDRRRRPGGTEGVGASRDAVP